MEIDLEEHHQPAVLELTYNSHMHFDVSDLDIDWTQVENIYCKYCTLTIHMKNGDEHEITNYEDLETDYKWPTKMTLFDIEWEVLDEE
tara:strand:+ start:236 stop:499 length:264 start_codon:yes stop_codon:yes gene_type:complete